MSKASQFSPGQPFAGSICFAIPLKSISGIVNKPLLVVVNIVYQSTFLLMVDHQNDTDSNLPAIWFLALESLDTSRDPSRINT